MNDSENSKRTFFLKLDRPAFAAPRKLFQIGSVYMTPGAQELLQRRGDEVGLASEYMALLFLVRHQTGDWAQMSADDRASNEAALTQGQRILSSYLVTPTEKIYVITEWDRGVTTLLLPNEY